MDNQTFVPSGYTVSDAALVSALDQILTPSSTGTLIPVLLSQEAKHTVSKPKVVTTETKSTLKEEIKVGKQVKPVKEKVVKMEEPKEIKIEPKEEIKEEVKKVEPKKTEEKQETQKVEDKNVPLPVEKLVPKENYRESPEFYEIANYFHVQPTEFEEAKHKLSLIYDWAAFQAQSAKPKDILTRISELERKIPPPAIGERRYLNAFRFVKLSQK